MPTKPTTRHARLPRGGRAFSLLELVAVTAILGLLAGMAAMRWGDAALSSASAEGFARSITLTLNLAQRQAIAGGDPAAVRFLRTSGLVTSVQLYRVTSGGDVITDNPLEVPDGVTVTPSVDRWEYNYSGSLATPTAGGGVTITQGVWTYTLTVNGVTGGVVYSRTN